MAACFRAAFGYAFLVLMVRVAGRRPGKQMTPFEFVLIFFIGGLTLTFMVADDRSLVNAFVQIITVALLHYSLVWLRRQSNNLARIIDGTPLVLLDNGEWRKDTLMGMRLQDDDVMAAAREQGLRSLDEIQYATLERNGEISIIRKAQA
ncbi:MAG TPA: YetF domain-containing protein [Acidisarcina sp.]